MFFHLTLCPYLRLSAVCFASSEGILHWRILSCKKKIEKKKESKKNNWVFFLFLTKMKLMYQFFFCWEKKTKRMIRTSMLNKFIQRRKKSEFYHTYVSDDVFICPNEEHKTQQNSFFCYFPFFFRAHTQKKRNKQNMKSKEIEKFSSCTTTIEVPSRENGIRLLICYLFTSSFYEAPFLSKPNTQLICGSCLKNWINYWKKFWWLDFLQFFVLICFWRFLSNNALRFVKVVLCVFIHSLVKPDKLA